MSLRNAKSAYLTLVDLMGVTKQSLLISHASTIPPKDIGPFAVDGITEKMRIVVRNRGLFEYIKHRFDFWHMEWFDYGNGVIGADIANTLVTITFEEGEMFDGYLRDGMFFKRHPEQFSFCDESTMNFLEVN